MLGDNRSVRRFCLTGMLVGILVLSPGCCSHRINEQLPRRDIQRVVVKGISFNRASLPEVFHYLNVAVDAHQPQSDMGPQFVLSPSLGSAEITLSVDAIALDELLKLLADIAHIRYIHSGRWVIVAPVATE
jgi:hypothetical protein